MEIGIGHAVELMGVENAGLDITGKRGTVTEMKHGLASVTIDGTGEVVSAWPDNLKIVRSSPAVVAASSSDVSSSGAGVSLAVTATAVSQGTGPTSTDNLAELVAAACAAHIDWGYGDFELRIDVVPRSDKAAASQLLKREAEVSGASAFLGQTPAAVIDGLANEMAILGYEEEHPLMAALVKKNGSFMAALLPDADAPIVEAFYFRPYDGNDCHAQFATAAFAFQFSYQTS